MEYQDKFIQLSRYAPEEVSTDEKKQHHFLDGLDGPTLYQVVAHTFSTFSQLVDKAFLLENKRHELQEKKRKCYKDRSVTKKHP
jgi:hypothetical protein